MKPKSRNAPLHAMGVTLHSSLLIRYGYLTKKAVNIDTIIVLAPQP